MSPIAPVRLFLLLILALSVSVHAAADPAAVKAESAPEAGPDPDPAAEPDADSAPEGGGDDADTGDAASGSDSAAGAEPTIEERVDAILAEVLAADDYRETENCLYRGRYRHIRIISTDYLLFEKGNRFWLNKLRRSCVGLKRRMVITTLTHGVQSLCANDLVYANHSSDLNQGFTPSGRPMVMRAVCTLGQFEQINEQQAQALLEP